VIDNVVFGYSIVATKVFLDQTGLTIPILFVFFTTMSFFEGKEDLLADFIEKFPVTFAVRESLYVLTLFFRKAEKRTAKH
jgi:hypothetical protein